MINSALRFNWNFPLFSSSFTIKTTLRMSHPLNSNLQIYRPIKRLDAEPTRSVTGSPTKINKRFVAENKKIMPCQTRRRRKDDTRQRPIVSFHDKESFC